MKRKSSLDEPIRKVKPRLHTSREVRPEKKEIMQYIDFISQIWKDPSKTIEWYRPCAAVPKKIIYSAFVQFNNAKNGKLQSNDDDNDDNSEEEEQEQQKKGKPRDNNEEVDQKSKQDFWQHMKGVICESIGSELRTRFKEWNLDREYYIRFFPEKDIIQNITKLNGEGKQKGSSSNNNNKSDIKRNKEKKTYKKKDNSGRKAKKINISSKNKDDPYSDSNDIDENETNETDNTYSKVEEKTINEKNRKLIGISDVEIDENSFPKDKVLDKTVEESPSKKDKVLPPGERKNAKVISNEDSILSKAVEVHALPAIKDSSNKNGKISAREINTDYNAVASSQINGEGKNNKNGNIYNTKKDDTNLLNHDGFTIMTSELRSGHPGSARMTWSLCDHHDNDIDSTKENIGCKNKDEILRIEANLKLSLLEEEEDVPCNQILNDIEKLGDEIYEVSKKTNFDNESICKEHLQNIRDFLGGLQINIQKIYFNDTFNCYYTNLEQIGKLVDQIYELSSNLETHNLATCKDQLLTVKRFLEKNVYQSPGEEVSFVASEVQSVENRNINEAQSAALRTKEARTECTDEENADEKKTNKALRTDKEIWASDENHIKKISNDDIDTTEVELPDIYKTVENQVVNDTIDNREKTWDIKYLENISKNFYIIRYDEKEILFPMTTLTTLLGKSSLGYV
jgi:hypothetical protein